MSCRWWSRARGGCRCAAGSRAAPDAWVAPLGLRLRSVIALELFNLLTDGLKILIQGLFEQAALLGAEALGLGGKLQPFENGVLVRELVDGGLFEGQSLEQGLHRFAQFVCAHIGELLWGNHHETKYATAP